MKFLCILQLAAPVSEEALEEEIKLRLKSKKESDWLFLVRLQRFHFIM